MNPRDEAYVVAQRTNEIGVRMALGATPGAIVGMVLRRAGLLMAAGLAIGSGVAPQCSSAELRVSDPGERPDGLPGRARDARLRGPRRQRRSGTPRRARRSARGAETRVGEEDAGGVTCHVTTFTCSSTVAHPAQTSRVRTSRSQSHCHVSDTAGRTPASTADCRRGRATACRRRWR